MRFGVLTSGGDAPGMNAAVGSFVRAGIGNGHEVFGIRNGYLGLLEEDSVQLSLGDVYGISREGGTMLGSARSKVFPTDVGQARGREAIRNLKLDGLVVIGGNGSLAGAHALGSDRVCSIVGLPASIDNDIGHCGMAMGVDTAVNTIVEACDRISDTARAHHRAFIVEVMGRHCGYLAMRSGIAAEADAILFAERNLSEDELVTKLREVLRNSFSKKRDKKRVLIVKAEGVTVPTQVLTQRLQQHLVNDAPGGEIRETILGHVVRGGRPSATDRVIAQRLGLAAATTLIKGGHDEMLAWDAPLDVGEPTRDSQIRRVGLGEMLDETAALLDGRSEMTQRRVAWLEAVEGLLAL